MPGTVTAKGLMTPREKRTAISPLAREVAPRESLLDVTSLRQRCFDRSPDVETRGNWSALEQAGIESHILAIIQALCDYLRHSGVDGPLHLGKDTHARSERTSRQTAGWRPGPPAPRTFTRFTPRASKTNPTWAL